jgi:hypothetical protein
MGRGSERGGNPRRQALGQRHVLWTVRSAGVRVAEAQRSQHFVVADDRDDERGGGCQLALQLSGGAPGGAVVVAVDPGAQRRLARSHDECDRAGEVVAPDAMGGDQRAHVAGQVASTMRRGDAAKRAGAGHVNKAEVGEPWERVPSRAIDRALICPASGSWHLRLRVATTLPIHPRM